MSFTRKTPCIPWRPLAGRTYFDLPGCLETLVLWLGAVLQRFRRAMWCLPMATWYTTQVKGRAPSSAGACEIGCFERSIATIATDRLWCRTLWQARYGFAFQKWARTFAPRPQFGTGSTTHGRFASCGE